MNDRKIKSFTLAETLTVLSVLGIIATLTMTSLMKINEERIRVSKVKEVYAIFSSAYEMAKLSDGDSEKWDIGQQATAAGGEKIARHFAPYVKYKKTCEKKDCFANNYTALFSNQSYIYQPKENWYYQAGILPNGTSVYFWSAGNGASVIGSIKFDINNTKGPNKAGIDLFSLDIKYEYIKGVVRGISNSYGEYCKYNDTGKGNGMMCTDWILKHGNMG